MKPSRRRLAMPKSPRWVFALMAALLTLVGLSAPAFAFKPPTLDGHVVDTANALTHDEILALDRKLEDVRLKTGFEIVAFVAGSLEGEPKEDVAYTCFNTWKIGKKGADNGVLLLIAPKERKTFLATGKGVEGALTDLQSDDILLQQVIPALKENKIYDAVDHGTSAIARTLSGSAGSAGSTGTPGAHAPRRPKAEPLTTTDLLIGGGVLVVIIFLSIVSSTFRSILGFIFRMFLFSGGGRGGGGSGGDSGSGYSGGGGSSGGGGAGEDY